MRVIKNVFVNGISLVSKNETPAVKQAENKFSLFKTKQNDNLYNEIQKNLYSYEFKEIQKNINVIY